MLQAIVFDMDGVIVDSHPVHRLAWKQFLLTLGKEVSDRDLDCILEGWKREEMLRYFLGELTDDQVTEYGHRKDEFFQQVGMRPKLVPGLRKFVNHLESLGIPKAIATSASQRRTRLTLDRLGLSQHFPVVITANDVVHGKPDPAVYFMAAAKMGVDPENIAVMEDSVSGVKAAKSAGMRCLGIAKNSRRALLRQAGADHVVANFLGITLDRLALLLLPSSATTGPQTRQRASAAETTLV